MTAWTPVYDIVIFHRTSIPQERRKRPIHDIPKSNLSHERTELERKYALFSTNHQAHLGHPFSSCLSYALSHLCHLSWRHCHLEYLLIRVGVPSGRPTSALCRPCWPCYRKSRLSLLGFNFGHWESLSPLCPFCAFIGLADRHHPGYGAGYLTS